MAVRCCQGDGDIELSYDPTQEQTQSDAARETGTLSCLTIQPKSRGVGWHMRSISGQLVLGTRQPIAHSMQPGRRGH